MYIIGESRVRATALVEEDLTASGFEKIKKTDENENVVIDIDVSEAFGKSQYTEADLIPCSADEAKEERSRKALRQAMLGSDKSPKAVESSKWTNNKSDDSKYCMILASIYDVHYCLSDI